jgi:pSer/pThr/pTyr-binding forkhead associated (FHA) protein
MSEKSIWSIIGRRLGGGEGNSPGSRTGEHTCPKGHPMDPGWTTCPRCDAESRAAERSAADAIPPSFSENAERSSNMSRNTIISPDESPAPRSGGTRIDPEGEFTPAPRTSAPQRKITGVLVTFTWDPQGDLFVLFEGRNVIGKGYVASEGGRPCDVLLHSDNTMSDEHAVILCRAGRYELFDRQSTNGTFVDERFVESLGVELKDGARIKTGSTVWLIRKIESEASGTIAEPPRRQRDEPYDPPPSRDPSRVS